MFTHCLLVLLILVLTPKVYAGKIIGGHEAVPHSRPYMAFLKRSSANGTVHCDGFLLNEDFVMTAAHCQDRRLSSSPFTVILGVNNAKRRDEDGIQNISVEQEFPHENYSQVSNDLMLLKLKTKAVFSLNVRPIDLPDEDDDFLPESCIVSGWGRYNKNKRYSSKTLLEVNVTLIDNEICSKKKSYCSEGEAGPAEGDSGGPLVCEDGKAYGVVSHTLFPLTGEPPLHFYSRIKDHRNWINSVINGKKKNSIH